LCNGRVSVFRVEDGSFARHVATGLDRPLDVEECEGGWLVACLDSDTTEFVGGDVDGGGVGRARLGRVGSGDGEFNGPTALALVPGLGLVVREIGNGGRVQVFQRFSPAELPGVESRGGHHVLQHCSTDAVSPAVR
jgi:hypothetical protein